jgi:hypothetical protein
MTGMAIDQAMRVNMISSKLANELDQREETFTPAKELI